MSLVHKKPRPITREVQTFRDDKLIIVACDDRYAPKQYFEIFQLPRVKVHVVETVDGSSHAKHVLSRLRDIEFLEEDERWLLLDTDHCTEGSHRPSFIEALVDANREGIHLAISKPCFEIWLLLHHIEAPAVTSLPNANEVCQYLRDIIQGYNKANLNIEKFPISSVPIAIARAIELDKTYRDGFIPVENATTVHHLVLSIVKKSPKCLIHKSLAELI